MAYFDNASTTYPKPESVYKFMDEFYRKSGANAGRGHYDLAQSAGNLISDTRKRIQLLLHCPAKPVVFTPSATIALNIIIQGVIATGVTNVYVSPFEHNAVTRTLHSFESKHQIKLHQLAVSADLVFDMQRIRYQFEAARPDFVILSHASNVLGLIAPAEEIFLLAKNYKAITLLDMAQTAGLIDCNIGLSSFDFAVFAGHKTLYGPTGISGFVMNPEINLPTTIFGGTGYESANQDMPESIPERFEMGTLNISGIAGLNASLRWIEELTTAQLRQIEKENRRKLLSILDNYDFLNIIGNYDQCNYVGIVSCTINGISSDSAAGIFDRHGIAVRTGLQCAPLAHQFIETYPAGTVRFSVSYFTSDEDFQLLKTALEQIEDSI